jgi:diaminopimelate epimerase
MNRLRVVKGHGTENDFVLVPDLDGALELSDALVRALCDRHAGIGADGVLRIVRSERHPDADGQDAPFFMDYRNADGSVAEMCGNGVRVFARWLRREGLVGSATSVATRGGLRAVRFEPDGNIAVAMGRPRFLEVDPVVTVNGVSATGRALEIPNPHVVVAVDSVEELTRLDLTRPPIVHPALEHGQNVEFVVRTGPRQLALRVHERGVGETRSCGTGICAAVVAVAADGASGERWDVSVPGGTCWVTWSPDGVELCGPAVLVADLELDPAWIQHAER